MECLYSLFGCKERPHGMDAAWRHATTCPFRPGAKTNLETQAKAFMDAVCPFCMDLPGPPCGKCGNPFTPEAEPGQVNGKGYSHGRL